MGERKSMSKSFSHYPFENLENLMKEKGMNISPCDVSASEKETLKDEALFLKAMKKVKEIREFRNIQISQKKRNPLCKQNDSSRQVVGILQGITDGKVPIRPSDTQEYVEWINPEYRSTIVQNLHNGQYSVQDSLDLHGYTVDGAELEVKRFIKDSLKKGLNCVKIIHGRGLRSPKGPVLKNALIRGLSQRFRKHLIAFVTARQCDGGLGAIYVLLRRR